MFTQALAEKKKEEEEEEDYSAGLFDGDFDSASTYTARGRLAGAVLPPELVPWGTTPVCDVSLSYWSHAEYILSVWYLIGRM
jgi:hypothetical protein